jgi:regulatory protein
MKITEISRQKKNLDRVSIFLDGEFWTGMSEQLFLDLGLYNNQEISEEDRKDIEDKVVKDSAFAFAVRSLSRKQSSVKVISEKMTDKGYGLDVVKKVVDKLLDLDLLNDQELAQAIIDYRLSKFEYRDKVRFRLKDAGIPEEIIEKEIINKFQDIDPLVLAKRSLDNRYRDQKLDLKKQNQALGYLQRNGFSYQIAQAAVADKALPKDEQAKINTKEKALDDLRKRYSKKDLDNNNFYNRANSFLLRKGYLPEISRAAVKEFSD